MRTSAGLNERAEGDSEQYIIPWLLKKPCNASMSLNFVRNCSQFDHDSAFLAFWAPACLSAVVGIPGHVLLLYGVFRSIYIFRSAQGLVRLCRVLLCSFGFICKVLVTLVMTCSSNDTRNHRTPNRQLSPCDRSWRI